MIRAALNGAGLNGAGLRNGLLVAIVAAAFLAPSVAHAYVGPGAGVAVVTTALVFVVSLVLAVVGLLLWPIRFVWNLVTRKKPPQKAKVRRAIIVGLDGLDPVLTKRFMDEGKLPNMSRIAAKGMFSNLGTTYPSMSPVAWSSFATGVNPAKHGIFDFLTRDPQTYAPDLSSADVGGPKRHIHIGGWQIPIGKPQIRLLRKSKPFWKVMEQYRVPASILRVPITFPAESLHGTMLSAMCVPDLEGTQGSFTYFTSAPAAAGETIGGRRIMVEPKDGVIESALRGPANPLRKDGHVLAAPFTVTLPKRPGDVAKLKLGKTTVPLEVGKYTDWLEVDFAMGLGTKLRGICRFRLLALEPDFRLYATPINIDPEKPILPISYPGYFSIFLSKLIGRYATLGLAEDTWALNEGVLDEDAFLEQAWANHTEREDMFFEMLQRTPKGVLACVFDGTDRIQHMFMRYLDDGHPAATDEERRSPYRTVIEETYARMDTMVGKLLEKVDMNDPANLVAVISDHGFKTFRRGINLNSWLHQHGYLVLEEGRTDTGEWFRGVDWSKSRAFALGLGGIFLNVRGREAKGCVEPGDEASELAREIADKLRGMRDPGAADAVAIQEVYVSLDLYKGPYAEDAPDLIIGYSAGWRASWDGVRGIVNDVVFDDNTKAWSGDHCIDPKLVPGVLIANQKLGKAGGEPAIMDMAPTLLELFGIPKPRYMDGDSLVSPPADTRIDPQPGQVAAA